MLTTQIRSWLSVVLTVGCPERERSALCPHTSAAASYSGFHRRDSIEKRLSAATRVARERLERTGRAYHLLGEGLSCDTCRVAVAQVYCTCTSATGSLRCGPRERGQANRLRGTPSRPRSHRPGGGRGQGIRGHGSRSRGSIAGRAARGSSSAGTVAEVVGSTGGGSRGRGSRGRGSRGRGRRSSKQCDGLAAARASLAAMRAAAMALRDAASVAPSRSSPFGDKGG